ncbi:hypothetical protein Tco_0990837 [Tanacetum coccineum]|uniref:Uncharacterized protein n=1 Tax=Tanacetum coccineum TaxID=301880 RepID=A0ABQ5EXM1_9ASTR
MEFVTRRGIGWSLTASRINLYDAISSRFEHIILRNVGVASISSAISMQCNATRADVDSYLPVVFTSSYAYVSLLKHFLPIINPANSERIPRTCATAPTSMRQDLMVMIFFVGYEEIFVDAL